jgi:hypothetical protein
MRGFSERPRNGWMQPPFHAAGWRFHATRNAHAQTLDAPAPPLPAGILLLGACQSTQPDATLARRYRDGEQLAYTMQARKQDRTHDQHYSAVAAITVHAQKGVFVEDADWRDLVVNGKPRALPSTGAAIRQELSLDPAHRWSMPDFAHIDPALIGPMLDLMTFYVDMRLAVKNHRLVHPGDHSVVPHNIANSWADGHRVLLGQDAIDFDIALAAIDAANRAATVVVRHVPPAKPAIRLPAKWMEEHVEDTANNWVEVEKDESGNGRFGAAVGKETFDVEMQVSLDDGRILKGRMDNVVDVVERSCADAALHDPGDPVRYKIHRLIEIALRDNIG